jgi:hypothetical protein
MCVIESEEEKELLFLTQDMRAHNEKKGRGR